MQNSRSSITKLPQMPEAVIFGKEGRDSEELHMRKETLGSLLSDAVWSVGR